MQGAAAAGVDRVGLAGQWLGLVEAADVEQELGGVAQQEGALAPLDAVPPRQVRTL